MISSIVVQTIEPEHLERIESIRRRLRLARLLVHRNTQPEVVRRYLLLTPGGRCDERRRTESERILRAQPFLASARIIVMPEARDSVSLLVMTEDELSPIVGLRIRGGTMERLRLGNSNQDGAGVSISAHYEYGGAYRYGVGGEIIDYQAFGRPWIAHLAASRNPLGATWHVSLREPFYTDLHPHSWYTGATRRHAFQGFQRMGGPDISLDFERTQWLTGVAWRIGPPERSVYLGPLAAGERTVADGIPSIVTDTAIVRYTGDGIEQRNYDNTAVRWGGLLGIRRIRYLTASGFDALAAPQDLASGVEATLLGARSFRIHGGVTRDFLVAASVYAGRAGSRSLVAMYADGEIRHDRDDGGWQSIVMSSRLAWYVAPDSSQLRSVSAEFSGGWDTRLPIQVTLSEPDAGMRGFREARVGGARRLIVRAEQRWVSPHQWNGRVDLGAAAFAEAGRLWSGDAPFGVTTPWQAGAGLSLMAAIPSGSKRVWRLDVAVPITDAGNPGRFELRARVRDLTRNFWREPGDIARTRDGVLLPRVLGQH